MTPIAFAQLINLFLLPFSLSHLAFHPVFGFKCLQEQAPEAGAQCQGVASMLASAV